MTHATLEPPIAEVVILRMAMRTWSVASFHCGMLPVVLPRGNVAPLDVIWVLSQVGKASQVFSFAAEHVLDTGGDQGAVVLEGSVLLPANGLGVIAPGKSN